MIAAGQSIGNYRILNKIGTGGMGAVYLAEHPLIGKRVALKVIHRELASNREVVQRFFQEAKAVNRIGDEHIVEIHDFGVTPEGDHFYIMEYLEGHNLATVLHHERVLAVMRALHVGAQVASALAAAHAAGIIHRDLKPDNVMLTTRLGDPDFVKLLDFGLAKMFAGDGSSAVKTAAGVLLGTPQYMSPEACESRQVIDHRTDIYALGILLFQMMTGVLPFDGPTMGEVLVKQVTQLPPPPRGYNANIPPSVEQILLRCLAKQPDARFPTMLALREALLDPERYLMASPPIAPTRSIAPGEAPADAKTIMAYAAQQQATRIGIAGEPPLGAPPAAPYAAGQSTIIGDGTLIPPRAPPGFARPAGPDMAVVAERGLSTHTMRIATPLGYSSRPPRRAWPIVLVLATLLGLVAGVLAVARFGKPAPAITGAGSDTDSGSAAAGSATAVAVGSATNAAGSTTNAAGSTTNAAGSESGSGAGSGSGSGAVSGSGSVSGSASGSAAKLSVTPLAPTTATIEIESVPPGAQIFGSDEESLGTTPAKLQLPIAATPVTYELRLPGYHKKTKQFVVTGDAVLEVPLDRLAPVHRPPPPRHGTPDDLMPP